MLGLQGLGSSGGFERLHYLLETAFDGPDLSMSFMKVGLLWGVESFEQCSKSICNSPLCLKT